MASLLEIKNLSAGYIADKPVLNDFSLQLHAGERIGIIGQNGCGKSTLAKAIMGITPYTQGTILWQGNSLLTQKTYTRNEQGIAYFMQGGQVFGNLSVKENLLFALKNKKNATFAKELPQLEKFDLELFKDKRRMQLQASNLSGGERHLLAFAMVLLGCPDMQLLIADEPSAGVAQKTQNQLLTIINDVLQEQNTALLLIEQNINFLNKLTNKIIKLTI
jgi:ABC-type branched-subunit amino acid transport system ATPase component